MDVSELHQKIKMYRGTPKKIFYTVSTMSKKIETQLGKWKSADSICIPMLASMHYVYDTALITGQCHSAVRSIDIVLTDVAIKDEHISKLW